MKATYLQDVTIEEHAAINTETGRGSTVTWDKWVQVQ